MSSHSPTQPRDNIEVYLKVAWEEIFGPDRVKSLNDNFFTIGGTSDLASTLANRLSQIYENHIPTRLVYEKPTIASMAAFLRQQEFGLPASTLVPVTMGGRWRPFFAVHPAGGVVRCYVPIARHLGPEQPFYALRASGLENGESPLTRVEDMAALYISEILKIQPEGPYQLGGYSLGGVIAYEIAQQLTAAGRDVSLLVMFDSVPQFEWVGQPVTEADIEYGENWRIRDLLLRSGFQVSEIEPLSFKDRLRLYVAKSKEMGAMPDDFAEGQYRRFIRIEVLNYYATTRLYNFLPYPGRITLLRSCSEDAGPDETYRWGELALKGVDVHKFALDHTRFLSSEPNATWLAAALAKLLDRSPYRLS